MRQGQKHQHPCPTHGAGEQEFRGVLAPALVKVVTHADFPLEQGVCQPDPRFQ